VSDRTWDPFRSRELLSALWMSSSVSSMKSGWTGGYDALLATFRRLVLDRRLSVKWADTTVSLTVTALGARPDPRALSVGQFGDIEATACDVTTDTVTMSRVRVILQNAHIRPGSRPVLIAAPVRLQAELAGPVVSNLMSGIANWLTAEVGAHGIGRLRFARFPQVGYLEVDPAIVGTTLTLRPRKLVVRGRCLQLPRWLPNYSLAVPVLHGLFVTDIELHPESVSISATLPEWIVELPRTRLDDIVEQLSAGSVLKLARNQPPSDDKG
jgi:hypothetical protein